jgi:hypothetical protein
MACNNHACRAFRLRREQAHIKSTESLSRAMRLISKLWNLINAVAEPEEENDEELELSREADDALLLEEQEELG